MWVEHKLFVVLYQKVLLEELSLFPDLTIFVVVAKTIDTKMNQFK